MESDLLKNSDSILIDMDFSLGAQAERSAKYWNEWFRTKEEEEWICDVKDIVKYIPSQILSVPSTLLEIGCGQSMLLEHLYDLDTMNICKFVAMDISHVAIENLKKRCIFSHRERISAYVADATRLPHDKFPTNSFDVVIDKGTSDSLQFRGRNKEMRLLRIQLFREVYRVLSKNGMYLVITPKHRLQFVREVGKWTKIDKIRVNLNQEANIIRNNYITRISELSDTEREKHSMNHCWCHIFYKGSSADYTNHPSEILPRIKTYIPRSLIRSNICYADISGTCPLGEDCRFVHSSLSSCPVSSMSDTMSSLVPHGHQTKVQQTGEVALNLTLSSYWFMLADNVSLLVESFPRYGLLPLALTSKTCLEAVRLQNIPLTSHVSCFLSSVSLLRWMLASGCETRYLLSWRHTAQAAAQNRLDVIQWLRSRHPPCPWNWKTCAEAVAEGHLSLLQWLRSQVPPCPWNQYSTFRAAQSGRLQVLQWLRSPDQSETRADTQSENEVTIKPGRQTEICPWDEGACRGAAEGGHLHILVWMHAQTPPCPWNESCCSAAAREGHLDVLQWVRAQTPPCPWSAKTCAAAAASGHLGVLQWLRSQNPSCPWDVLTCNYAARGGHLHILQWLFSSSHTDPCGWDEDTCVFAAEGGHLSVMQWLRAQQPPCPWNDSVCAYAAKGGHLLLLQWLRAQEPPCPWDEETFVFASTGGYKELVKWLMTQSPVCPSYL
mmetsp:Transcript_20310/g.20431  ORF Transcript_20310/g.20431 Transcript_20310/m.20431 type:complete len:720 (+) Transcript_20310:228-2387(+)